MTLYKKGNKRMFYAAPAKLPNWLYTSLPLPTLKQCRPYLSLTKKNQKDNFNKIKADI